MSVDIALIMRKYVHTFSASCLNWALKSFFLFTLLHGILCGFSEFLQLHTSVYLRHSLCLSVILLLYIDSGWFISILHVDIYNCYFSVIVFTWKDFYLVCCSAFPLWLLTNSKSYFLFLNQSMLEKYKVKK